MKHSGIRPVGELREIDDGRFRSTYKEILQDGGYRLWNNKLLKSGCGKTLTELQEKDSLLYCPHCEEWFSKNQFSEDDDVLHSNVKRKIL